MCYKKRNLEQFPDTFIYLEKKVLVNESWESKGGGQLEILILINCNFQPSTKIYTMFGQFSKHSSTCSFEIVQI